MAERLVAALHWRDFEILVDRIFADTGWRRVGVLGETQVDVPAHVANIAAPFQRRRRGVETKLAYGYEQPKVDAVLLRRVARGYAW